jgi:hypothetical protein
LTKLTKRQTWDQVEPTLNKKIRDNDNNKLPFLGTKIRGPNNESEQKLIRKLALDIKTWGMEFKVGKKYMETFLKRDISEPTYFRYLASLDTDESLKAWIEEQARVGFVRNQRDMTEQILRLITKVDGLLAAEIAKDDTIEVENKSGSMEIPNPNKNKMYILGLIRQLIDLNKRIEELNLGNPIVATIKYMIDHTNDKREPRNVPLKAVLD